VRRRASTPLKLTGAAAGRDVLAAGMTDRVVGVTTHRGRWDSDGERRFSGQKVEPFMRT
jgi:hypothetical protein